MAGAAEAELTALREQQEANAAEFEDLLSCLGQETAKVYLCSNNLTTVSLPGRIAH